MLRYPGRLPAPGEFIPPAVVDFIGRQLDLDGYELADYAVRSETRHEHLAELRRLYGFRSFSDHAARELGDRLREEAPLARSNEDLARRFVDACRQTRTILPTTTTIERLCADALVDAERRIEARIAERVPPGLRWGLENLLRETVDGNVTRFVWLRLFILDRRRKRAAPKLVRSAAHLTSDGGSVCCCPGPTSREGLRLTGDSSTNTGMECAGSVEARVPTRFPWWTVRRTGDAAVTALLPCGFAGCRAQLPLEASSGYPAAEPRGQRFDTPPGTGKSAAAAAAAARRWRTASGRPGHSPATVSRRSAEMPPADAPPATGVRSTLLDRQAHDVVRPRRRRLQPVEDGVRSPAPSGPPPSAR